MKNFIYVLIGLLLLTGCNYTTEVVPEETDIQEVTYNQETGKTETTQVLDVKGEPFQLVCEYDTGRYDLSKWRITDSKSLGMLVHTKNLPEGYDVYIDHIHADISIKAVTPQVDGIIQDSMDDSSHSVSGNEYIINNETNHYNIFAIEGYTSQFYEMWGYACGEYGHVSSSYQTLSENNIIKAGAYAQKVQVVYDLSIKGPNDPGYHTVSVLSEILIPINTNVENNEQDVNLFTGEVSSEASSESTNTEE